MARPRTHHEEKKQELIRIAFDLFMRNGYENTSIQDVMNAAQISKGAMYHYFTCKEDILDAVLHYIIDLDAARFDPIFNDASLRPIEKLIATFSFNMPQPSAEVAQATDYVMQRPASIFDYRARELSKSRITASLADLIREGVAAGEFHTDAPDEMAAFICSAAQTMPELVAQQSDPAALRQALSAFLRLLTHCLGLKQKEQDFLTDFFENQFTLGPN